MGTETRILHIHDPQSQAMPSAAIWRVAFASDDLSTVNQHFGMASGFSIYAVSEEEHPLITVVRLGAEEEHAHGRRLQKRMSLLNGCDLLYCVAIGEAARQQLMELGIVAITVPKGSPILPLLRRLPSPSSLPPARRRVELSDEQKDAHFSALLGGQWEEESVPL
jgi:nitrogen fixation protein NifX